MVSKAGWLISGLRRLEAVRRLGWREVDVWVAAKVSDQLQRALAVRDENGLRKDLNPLEAAKLYAELKELYAGGSRPAPGQHPVRRGEDRARRFRRFDGTVGRPGPGGPRDHGPRLARHVRAGLELQRGIADDTTLPAWVRGQVEKGLAGIRVDGKVNGRYLAITTARARHELEQAAADDTQPAAARDLAKGGARTARRSPAPASRRPGCEAGRRARPPGRRRREPDASAPKPRR